MTRLVFPCSARRMYGRLYYTRLGLGEDFMMTSELKVWPIADTLLAAQSSSAASPKTIGIEERGLLNVYSILH